MTPQWWAEPTAGDIVWCHFPDDIHPRPKPGPALILAVFDDDAPQFTVRVACGTSQRTTTLHRGEFSILRERNSAAYETAGLSDDTKFDLRQALHHRVVLGAASCTPRADTEAGHLAPVAGASRPGGVPGSHRVSRRLAFRLEASTVEISRNEHGELALHPVAPDRGSALLQALAGFDDSFIAALEAQRQDLQPAQERTDL